MKPLNLKKKICSIRLCSSSWNDIQVVFSSNIPPLICYLPLVLESQRSLDKETQTFLSTATSCFQASRDIASPSCPGSSSGSLSSWTLSGDVQRSSSHKALHCSSAPPSPQYLKRSTHNCRSHTNLSVDLVLNSSLICEQNLGILSLLLLRMHLTLNPDRAVHSKQRILFLLKRSAAQF